MAADHRTTTDPSDPRPAGVGSGGDAKADLRRRYRACREQADAGRAIAAAAATALAPLVRPGLHVGLYWPIGGEPDLRPLARPLTAAGGLLALPAVSSGHMRYRPWQPGDTLSPDDCGIAAPPPAATPTGALEAADLGLLLAPALALDRRGIRLGYGGGWFDRLRAEPAWRSVPALAVLPERCLLEVLPADPWDVPFDGWLDERGLHWLQAV